MKILSVKKNEKDTTFKIEIDGSSWKNELINTKKYLAKNLQVQGFRKGHVPQSEIDKRISDVEVGMRALEKQQNKIIQDIIGTKEFTDSNCLDYVCKFEISSLQPTPIIEISFEHVPKVENFDINDVKEISIPPYNAPNISDILVKQQIKMMIKPDAMLSSKKDETIAKGNIAIIDFKGFIDGKPFKGRGKNFELEIGSKSFIDTFEDQLIGCKKGDKKDVNVKFPEDYHSTECAGKPARFEVVINDVKEIEYPEITKDYCKKFGMDCANMKELEAHIKDLFTQESKMKHQDSSMKIINEAIGKKAKLDYYPAGLLNMHKNQILNKYEQEAKKSGFSSLKNYKKVIGVDQKTFEEMLDKSAKTTLTITMAYEKLISEYDLKVDKFDMDNYLSKLTKYFGDEKKAKELCEKNKDQVEASILKDKLFKKLISDCKKEEKK